MPQTSSDSSRPRSSSPHPPERLPLRWLAFALPVVALLTLLAIYFIDRDFYLTYVLEYQHREYQAVEMITFGSAVLAGVLLVVAAGGLWRQRPRFDVDGSAVGSTDAGSRSRRMVTEHGPAALVVVIAAACLFLAGEEVSWGQTFINWGIPEKQKPQAYETNLHNNLDIPLQSVGQLFLIGVFFVLPALWALRDRVNLPPSFRPTIAEPPVIFCAAIAFAWKLVKEIYVGLYGKMEGDTFYWGFIEQINEQKEMLIAISLLMYALYRLRHVKLREGGPAARGVTGEPG